MEIQIYVGYEDVFHTSPPEDRLSLIERYSKRELLASLSLINLHPSKDPIYHNLSWENQMGILAHLCMPDRQLFDDLIQINIFNKSLLKGGASGVLFSRVANIVAMNEILESDRVPHQSEERLNVRHLIEYYLSINSFLKREQDKYEIQKPSLLDYYLVMAVYNEYNTPFFSFLELFRGVELINYMQNDADLSADFNAYFDSIGIDPFIYFPLVFSHVIPITNNREANVPLFKPMNKLVENVVRTLSDREIVPSDPIEALNLKKNAFYAAGDNLWLLLDESFLIDHCFYYTINSFWFNHMKQIKYSHKTYFGKIGRFYETYIAGMIKRAFRDLDNPTPKTLDDLKIKNPKGNEIEVADIYLRENENIFIAEIKSTAYGVRKYASDIISDFQEKESKARFIKDFGLFQVLKAIKFISEYHTDIDENLPDMKEFQIFPAVIFSERLFQTPIANLFFQNLFLDFFTEVVGEFDRPRLLTEPMLFKKFKIHPISLVHTTELELLEPFLANKRVDFWMLLRSHQQTWGLQVPLYHSIMMNFDQHELIEYTFQRVRPIFEDYDKRRKELLTRPFSPELDAIKIQLQHNELENKGLILQSYYDEGIFKKNVSTYQGEVLEVRIEEVNGMNSITIYTLQGESIGGVINPYAPEFDYKQFAEGLRGFLDSSIFNVVAYNIEKPTGNRTYFCIQMV